MSEMKPLHIVRQTSSSIPAPAAAASTTVSWPAVAERLREYAAVRGPSAVERCDLCGAAIETEHGHLVNVPTRSLLCVCRACYLLFTPEGAGGARFRSVPQRYRLLPEFADARDEWTALEIPIGLAFFFRSSATGRATAFYPSPAGATESELSIDAWDNLVRAVPPLAQLVVDVEALLVRRSPAGPVEALIAPIDACYELVGRIRRSWRGFTGGDEVWRQIDDFFAHATERASRAENGERPIAAV